MFDGIHGRRDIQSQIAADDSHVLQSEHSLLETERPRRELEACKGLWSELQDHSRCMESQILDNCDGESLASRMRLPGAADSETSSLGFRRSFPQHKTLEQGDY